MSGKKDQKRNRKNTGKKPSQNDRDISVNMQENSATGAFDLRDKWNALWEDDRPFKKRLLLSIFPSLLLVYILLFFGPLDIFLSNARFFNITYRPFLLPFSLIGLASFILLSIAVAASKGKVYDFLIYLLLGIALCCYVQGSFLNLDLGALDGDTIPWHLYDNHAAVNLAIWMAILLLVFAISYFFKSIFPRIVVFICCALVIMQTAALVVGMVNAKDRKPYYLSGADEYTLSASGNVVVFILDNFSNSYLTQVLKKSPDALEPYHDFIYYDNYNTGYKGTFPGELHMITGQAYDFDLTYEEFFESAWNSGFVNTYLQTLQNAGYKMRVYSQSPSYLCGSDLSRLDGKVANLKKISSEKLPAETIKKFIKLSLFRYVPHAMKANFWMSSGDLAFSRAIDDVKTDHLFVESLRERGLSIQKTGAGNERYVTFFMLPGAHRPYTMDANGNYVSEGTSATEQATGCLTALNEYMDEMKRLGIYDDATIIITADHGTTVHPQAVFMIKKAGAQADAIQKNSAPVSQTDFPSTVLDALSLPHDDLGPSVFDFQETDVRERSCFLWRFDDAYPDLGREYNVMYEFRYTGTAKELDAAIKDDRPTEIHALRDCFY